MGLRFRKSFKIAPDVKLNLNKKSAGLTFGGKGVHYTVNTKGKRTKSIGIPGSGLYYTETNGGSKSKKSANATSSKLPNTPTTSNSSNNNGDSNKGCFTCLLAFIIICVALAAYAYAWIPAIGCIIYFSIKKDVNGTKRKKILVSVGVLITSLLVSIWLSSTQELTSIYADWGKSTYDVTDITEVKITSTPSDASIDSLELSENSIAELEYKDEKAIITFKKAGEATLFFTANDEIKSNSISIKVTDKAAEEKARKAEEAKKKAEEEAKRKAEEEARIAAEQEAKRKAEEEAQIKSEQQTATQSQNQSSEDPIVYTTNTGSKYHRAGCRTLKKSKIEQKLSDVKGIYEPCGICNPPQ